MGIVNPQLPVIDIRALISQTEDRHQVARQIGDACREWGFFYVTGHGVDPRLIRELEEGSRRFFAQDLEKKLEIKMARGGRAWRGYFPVGDELTSGYPDAKEGIYFGAELDDDHPMVQAKIDSLFRSEEHTSELQSLTNLVCRLLLEKKKKCSYLVKYCFKSS